jgi:acyl-CoA thioester hydrolase
MTRSGTESRWWAETEIEVQFYDLDPMNVVWHGNYVKYLEVARCALLNKIGYDYPAMKESGYAWPVIDMQIRYVGPAVFNQRLRLRAEIVEWENRLKIHYVVSDAQSGKRITKATTVQVAVDMASGEMCFVSPAVLLEKLGIQ